MNGTVTHSLIEIHRTVSGAVYQCNIQNSYWLEFSGVKTAFKAGDFIDFIRKINDLSLEELLSGDPRSSETTILMPLYCDRCFILSLNDILALRDLLNTAKFYLQLNSVLNECLISTQRHAELISIGSQRLTGGETGSSKIRHTS
jgi:hypothetical protein